MEESTEKCGAALGGRRAPSWRARVDQWGGGETSSKQPSGGALNRTRCRALWLLLPGARPGEAQSHPNQSMQCVSGCCCVVAIFLARRWLELARLRRPCLGLDWATRGRSARRCQIGTGVPERPATVPVEGQVVAKFRRLTRNSVPRGVSV